MLQVRGRRRSRARSGFTLIETCISIGVMTLAMAMFAGVLTSTARMRASKREESLAAYAARSALESMRCRPFDQCWALYDTSPSDDPGGAGSAPGRYFAVEGLELIEGDPDGFVGELLLPGDGAALREDLEDQRLGLPRDLNGDTLIDGLDHAADYRILPVGVRVEWRGAGGPRRLEMYTMLFDWGS